MNTIKVQNNKTITMLISGLKACDFSAISDINRINLSYPQNINKLVYAFSDDILASRQHLENKDRSVELEFSFREDGFSINIDHSYSFLHKGAKFYFSYNSIEKENININQLLGDSIDLAIEDRDADIFDVIDIEQSSIFLKHLKIIDDALDYNNELYTYANKSGFVSTLSPIKDKFDFFNTVKGMRKSPYLELIAGDVNITCYWESIILTVGLMKLDISVKEMPSTSNKSLIIQSMLINLFNATHETQINNINDFKLILGMITI